MQKATSAATGTPDMLLAERVDQLRNALGHHVRTPDSPYGRKLPVHVVGAITWIVAIMNHLLIAVAELQRATRLSHSEYRTSIWS